MCPDTWPWQQQCQTWGTLTAPPGLEGSLPQMWSTSNCPFLCASTTHTYVCACAVGGSGRTVLFQAAGYVKDHSELPRAPTPQHLQQQLQVLALCSTCPGTCPAPCYAPPRASEQMQEPSAQSPGTV